jgi:hypothetical protein
MTAEHSGRRATAVAGRSPIAWLHDPCHALGVRRFAHPLGTTFAGAARWLAGLALAVGVAACGEDPKAPSSLAERARATPAETPAPTATPPADPAPPADSAPPPVAPSADTPPADTPPIALTLALDPAVKMRITTVGMVELPVVERPTGFAIQEGITLDGCEGEGTARRCRVHHRFLNFEAEPPAGRFLEADHARVADIARAHDIGADGRALSPTALEGEVDAELRESLARAHALHCIRLPPGPVTVGATWTDTCSEWARGAVGAREITWTLARVDDDEGTGRRAELRYRGTLTQPSKAGERTGTVQGVLYFFADAGQPHLLREQIAMPLKAGGAVTKTTLNIQFARVDPAHPDTLLRMDGRPFPVPPKPTAGNPPASPDAADTPPSGKAAATPATPDPG